MRDFIFMCPNRNLYENWLEKSGENVYTYVWAENIFNIFIRTVLTKLGTFHGSELFYLFESYAFFPAFLSAPFIHKPVTTPTIQCYWANFIHSGNPSQNIPECEAFMNDKPTWKPVTSVFSFQNFLLIRHDFFKFQKTSKQNRNRKYN